MFLTLYNFASIPKNVPELILETVIHMLMFLVKTNEIHLYVMLGWEGIKGKFGAESVELMKLNFF